MRRLSPLIVGLALVAAACGQGEITATSTTTSSVVEGSGQHEALAAARARWSATAPADYTMSVVSDDAVPQTLAVHEGDVVSLGAADTATVDVLFATIDESLRAGATVDVEYDPQWGHPTRIVIDRDRDGVAEIDISLGNLEEMPIVTTLEELRAAEARWEELGPSTYRYVFRAECTCGLGGTFDVEVRDDAVFAVVQLDDAARSSPELTPTPLDGAFADLEEWFTDNAQLVAEGLLEVDVRMDPALGYPRWFNIVGQGLGDGFEGEFTLVVTMDLVLPYTPIEEPPAHPSADAAELAAAQERWERANLTDYQFILELICECPLAYSGPFEVTVLGGAVTEVIHLGDVAGARPEAEPIPEFFEIIGRFVDSGIDIDVAYHPILGYPTLAILDTAAVAVDGGMAFALSGLGLPGDRGMIVGRAVAGPQCPVQQEPPQPECSDVAVSAAVILFGAGGREGPEEIAVEADGTFVIPHLEPGTYLLAPQPLDEYMSNPAAFDVVVAAGAINEVEIYYDTGIR